MSILRSVMGVGADFKAFFWPAKHWQKVVRLGVLFIVLLLVARGLTNSEPTAPPTTTPDRSVTLITANDVRATQTGAFVGTVRAVSEAQIQNEVAGRVTSVAVRPGDEVVAGAVIATLENSAQAAAVLQAEGAYEQAVANAAVTTVGEGAANSALTQSANAAIVAVTTAIDSLSSLYNGALDTIVADPNNVYRTGSVLLRDDAARIQALETNYNQLPQRIATAAASTNEPVSARSAQTAIDEIQTAITAAAAVTNNARSLASSDNLDRENDPDEASFFATLSSADSTLNGLRASIRSAESQLVAAADALTQAQLTASNDTVSVADAQVKSALGALRAAQAQLAKTILRTPIAGTVNNVGVNSGDFIGAFTPVAEIANNGGLEVSFFVTDTEAARLTAGQTVRFDESATGTIVSIAPAVNQATQKTEIKASVTGSSLVNGSNVLVKPVADTTNAAATGPIRVPIDAVRFTADAGFVFVVTEENVLERVPVSLGTIVGSTVEITDGITATTSIVADARGLADGQSVSVTRN